MLSAMMAQEAQPYLHDIRQRFMNALTTLGGKPLPVTQEVEAFIESYQGAHRYYHDLGHIDSLMTPLELTGDDEVITALRGHDFASFKQETYNALKALSALRHDCVYLSTDGGLGPSKAILAPYVQDDKLVSVEAIEGEKHKQIAQMVRRIFFISDDEIPIYSLGLGSRDQNELLSALATATVLDKAGLSQKDILGVVCLIEATQPFRPQHDHIMLKGRLQQVAAEMNIALKPAEIDRIMTLATHFANQDVDNFKGPFPPFIQNGLKILPEMNEELRGQPPTSKSFLQVLNKELKSMNLFEKIAPHIFHDDGKGYPSHNALQQYRHAVETNIVHAREYLKAKLVSVSYLDALCNRLDQPEVMLKEMLASSELPYRNSESDNPVYKALRGEGFEDLMTTDETGQQIRFDISDSPITRYLWENVGSDTMAALYDEAVAPYMDAVLQGKGDPKQQADALLEAFNRNVGPEVAGQLYDDISKGTALHGLRARMRESRESIVPAGPGLPPASAQGY